MKNPRIIDYLKQLATSSKMSMRHACAIVSKGRILSAAVNSTSGHAEQNAIRRFSGGCDQRILLREKAT